jgi:hypothetical protein
VIDDSDKASSLIIIGLLAFVAIIIFGIVIRCLYNKSIIAEIDQQKKTMDKI